MLKFGQYFREVFRMKQLAGTPTLVPSKPKGGKKLESLLKPPAAPKAPPARPLTFGQAVLKSAQITVLAKVAADNLARSRAHSQAEIAREKEEKEDREPDRPFRL